MLLVWYFLLSMPMEEVYLLKWLLQYLARMRSCHGNFVFHLWYQSEYFRWVQLVISFMPIPSEQVSKPIHMLEILSFPSMQNQKTKFLCNGYSVKSKIKMYTCRQLCCQLVPRGKIGYARHLFNQTPWMIPAVWNAIITGCVENKHTEIALNLFPKMHQLGVRHDKYAFASILWSCWILEGRCIH